MKNTHLGQEMRRLRTKAGYSLRALAAELNVSASHLSDVEHNRRCPSEPLLRGFAIELRGAGATYAALEKLLTGLDLETRMWANSTPGARTMLRRIVESGLSPSEILRALDKPLVRAASRKHRKVR